MQQESADELRFEGRVMIVTGAGRGMGREHALLLAKRGARVVVNDIGVASAGRGGDTSGDPAQSVVDEIRSRGGEAIVSLDSVATQDGAEAVVTSSIDEWGRIDGVLHNAAIARYASVEHTSAEDYEAVRAVSLDGALFLTKAAWPHMVSQKFGRFVHITSGGGIVGVPHNTPYAMAKTGLIGLMNISRIEGANHDINVNLLGVAAFTRMTKGMFGSGDAAAETETWWERYLRSDLVAPVAAWLLHEQCDTTGAIFNAAGGHVSRTFLAETVGYTKLGLSIEDVRDHQSEINDEAGYFVMRSAHDINAHLGQELVKAGADRLAVDPLAIQMS